MEERSRREVLIIRLSAIGDVAMTLPIIEVLVRDNPEVKITVLTSKMVVPLFSHIQGLEVVGWDTKREGKIKDIFKIFTRLTRKHRFDAVIDLHDVLRSKLLRFCFAMYGSLTYKIDKGRVEKKLLIEHKINKPLKSTIERYRDTLQRAGLVVDRSEPQLQHKEMNIPSSITQLVGEKRGIWVGIAPFAKHKGKRYPLELMARVMDILYERGDITFFIFSGGGDEREEARSLAGRYRDSLAVFGTTLMDGELRLISNLDVMVSMDSSAMHFASAVGTPVVSIWGATHHHAGFLGYGQSVDSIVESNLECRPCSVFGNKPCKRSDYACMNNIKPEEIVEKINLIIKNR